MLPVPPPLPVPTPMLQSDDVPPSLEDDIHRLEQQSQYSSVNDSAEVC